MLTLRAHSETLLSLIRYILPGSVSVVKQAVLLEIHTSMESLAIDELALRIQEHRAGKGIREAAKEVGVSSATLSRVENGKVPDLETFGKICQWLGDDPSIYLGLKPRVIETPRAQVHFKKGAAIEKDSAKALSEMIMLARKALLEEELQD